MDNYEVEYRTHDGHTCTTWTRAWGFTEAARVVPPGCELHYVMQIPDIHPEAYA